MAAPSPSVLISESRCFEQCIPPGMQLAVMNYLLYLIASLGGGGGGGGAFQVFEGNGPPTGLQTGQNPLLAAVYYDLDAGGESYVWNVTEGNWGD